MKTLRWMVTAAVIVVSLGAEGRGQSPPPPTNTRNSAVDWYSYAKWMRDNQVVPASQAVTAALQSRSSMANQAQSAADAVTAYCWSQAPPINFPVAHQGTYDYCMGQSDLSSQRLSEGMDAARLGDEEYGIGNYRTTDSGDWLALGDQWAAEGDAAGAADCYAWASYQGSQAAAIYPQAVSHYQTAATKFGQSEVAAQNIRDTLLAWLEFYAD